LPPPIFALLARIGAAPFTGVGRAPPRNCDPKSAARFERATAGGRHAPRGELFTEFALKIADLWRYESGVDV
jgi:hypothetical protein